MTARIDGVLLIREYPDNPEAESTATFWCPGCNGAHTISYGDGTSTWTWDGNAERPTFEPSVLANGIRGAASEEWNRRHPRCHSFVRDGHIQYLSDSEHELAGQTIPMGPLPDKYAKFVED